MRSLDLAATVHQALAHPARLRILAMLRGGELCACQVTAVLALAPSTVSAHLAALKAAGLVVERKEGRWVHYRLASAPDARARLSRLWREISEDPQVASDARVLARLRRISPEALCQAGLDLERLKIVRVAPRPRPAQALHP